MEAEDKGEEAVEAVEAEDKGEEQREVNNKPIKTKCLNNLPFSTDIRKSAIGYFFVSVLGLILVGIRRLGCRSCPHGPINMLLLRFLNHLFS